MESSLAGKVALVAGATRTERSEMNRPETIEETAALVHIVANDIFGATKIEWNKSVWESDLDYGLRTLRLAVNTTTVSELPGIVRIESLFP